MSHVRTGPKHLLRRRGSSSFGGVVWSCASGRWRLRRSKTRSNTGRGASRSGKPQPPKAGERRSRGFFLELRRAAKERPPVEAEPLPERAPRSGRRPVIATPSDMRIAGLGRR